MLLGLPKSSPDPSIRKGIPRFRAANGPPRSAGPGSGTGWGLPPAASGIRGAALRPIQWPKRFVGANMPLSSKYRSASSTERKIFVAVSVMNGLGFFFGFHTT